MTESRVWACDHSTVVRVSGATQQGCGGSTRLYAGRLNGFDYDSYVHFATDWAGVGTVVRATLTITTADGAGLFPLRTSPKMAVRKLASAFVEGNNASGHFDASDWTAPRRATALIRYAYPAKAAGESYDIDVTDWVRSWAPATVQGGSGTAAAAALRNRGIALNGYTAAKQGWQGWSRHGTTPPYITIEYDYGATVPNAPDSLSPSGDVVSIGAFEADFSDIRPSDTLAATEVEVSRLGTVVHTQRKTASSTERLSARSHVVPDGFHPVRNEDYTWRVRQQDSESQWSPWSADVTFSVTNADPDEPTGANTSASSVPTLRGVRFRTGTFSDPDAGDTLAAHQIQMSTYPEGDAHWDDPDFLRWDTGKVFAPSGATEGSSLYGGRSTDAGGYWWRVRVFDQHGGVSPWHYNALTLTADFTADPGSQSRVQHDPHAPWRIRIREMEFNAVGGSLTGGSAGPEMNLGYHVTDFGQPGLNVYARSTTTETAFAAPWHVDGAPAPPSSVYVWDPAAPAYHYRASVYSWTGTAITLFPGDMSWSWFHTPSGWWRMRQDITDTLITSAAKHGLKAGRRVRFSALTGGAGLVIGRDYYVLADGLTTTAFKVSETLNGSAVALGTQLTAGTVTAVTTRGPGSVVAVLEDSKSNGASIVYNSPGECHFTLSPDHPQVSVIEPMQVHYGVDFYGGDGWRETFAGLVYDFDATERDVVFKGVDYLGLLDWTLDDRYFPASPKKAYNKGGSYYPNVKIRDVVLDQLRRARFHPDSPVGFISIGTVEAMDERVYIWSTMEPALSFISGLLDSHRAGTAKNTRIQVKRTTGGAYEFTVTDDPGRVRDNVRLAYGELVQGYRLIPFGSAWASVTHAIGQTRNSTQVLYGTQSAPGIDTTVWGRIARAATFSDVANKKDLDRRLARAAIRSSKLGQQVGLAIRTGLLKPLDGYDICDAIPVSIRHGVVNTDNFGSGYWVCHAVAWEAGDDASQSLVMTLLPRDDQTPADPDLIDAVESSPQAEWQIGWTPPDPALITAQFYLDQATGKTYIRTESTGPGTAVTGSTT